MQVSQTLATWGLLGVFTGATLAAPLAPAMASSGKRQQEATAASLAEAALLYNYARRQNTTNGALALAGAAGTAYLWNQYAQERRVEKRQEQARMNYYRRRASYYHRLARSEHRRAADYHHRSSR